MPTRPASYTLVSSTTGPSSCTLIDASGQPVEPVTQFLTQLAACDQSRATLRSYAYDLLDWFRFLAGLKRPWAAARQSDVRDYVLSLRTRSNPRRKHETTLRYAEISDGVADQEFRKWRRTTRTP